MKKVLLFMLTILTLGFFAAPLSAQDAPSVLTVADGSSTNGYVPMYGLYLDEAQHNQIIYPESMLGDMVTGEISEMKFHLQNSVSTALTSTITVSLGTTTTETFTSGTLDDVTLTQVYTGAINLSGQEFTITFSTPFTYNGGNLLFDITTTAANWATTTFYGISSTGSSYAYNSVRNFIPKTTFTYTGGALCKTPYGLTSSEITTSTATISWRGDDNASSYNVQYMPSSQTDWANATTVPAYDTVAYLTGLQASSTYKVRVQIECSDNTQTVWSGVHTFMTACDIIPFTDPWFEDFEGYTGGGAQQFVCWATPVTASVDNGTSPFVYCGHSPSCHSGSNSAEFKGNSGAMNIAVLPEFSEDIHSLRLTFWATSTNPSYGTMEVGVMTDASDTSTFELVAVCGTPGPRGASGSFGNGSLMGPFDFNGVQATSGRIALRFTSNSASLSWNLDDFTVTYIPQCAEPTNLATGNVTATSAELSWNESDGATYDVVYWEVGDSDTTIVPGAFLTDGAYLLDNLNPSSSYTWYVRTDCGDGTYANSYQQLTFNTPGTPVELPYVRTFEEGDDDPVTEFTFQGTGDNQWAIGTATFKPEDASDTTETGHSLYISNDNGVSNAYSTGNNSYAYAILNATFDEPLEYHLSFDYKTMGEGGYTTYDYLSVYLMDASAVVPTEAIPSGTALLSQQYSVGNWTHADYVLENVNGTTKQIVFFWRNDSSAGTNPPAAIDNISIAGFSCAQPAQLTVTNIASDNVTIDWNEVGTSTSWTVSYGPAGYTVGDDDDEMIEVVTDHPYTITGLTPATSYDIYVQSDCGSNWSGPLTVTPGSYNMSVTGSDTIATCGMAIYDNGGLTGDYSTNCNYTLVVNPATEGSGLSITGTVNTYNAYASYAGVLTIYAGVGTSGTVLGTYSGITTVNIAYAGPVTLNFTSGSYYAGAGFELIVQCTDCFPPTDVTVSGQSMDGATVSWSGSADEYAVILSGAMSGYYTTTSTSYTFTGLNSSSTYNVQVRALCGSDSSLLSQSASFNTACGDITVTADIPWTETFEGYVGGGEQPFVCWETPVHPNGPFVYCGYAQSCHSGQNSAEFKGAINVLVLPSFTNDLSDLRLSFWATAVPHPGTGAVEIGYMTDINDTSTFVFLADAGVPGPRGSQDGVSGNGSYMGPFDFNGVTAPAGSRIALRYTNASNTTASWNLDDFTVELVPDCPSPVKTSVTVTDIDGHNATVTFTDNDPDHNSWTLYYKAAGDADWSSELTSVTSVTLSGLDPETTYEVYVVTNCNGTPSEDATNHKTFTTAVACPAPQNVTVSNIGMTGATVTWTSNAASFTVEYGEAGFTPGAGTIATVTSNTYDLSGLTAGTAYTVYVTADCGGDDGSSTAASANFNTAMCEVIDQCEYTFNLTDSYGDGWNGNTITVQQNGITVATVGLTSGSSATVMVTLCDNQPTTLIWNTGSYPGECSFEVLNSYGDVIYTSSGTPSGTLTTFNTSCAPITCPRPADITVSNIGSTTADVSWTSTGTETAWNVEYKVNTDATWTVISVTTNPYTLTNLTASTNYDVRVQADCGNGDVSDYRETSFLTACDVVTNYPYVEGFENGLGCWQSVESTYTNYNWETATNDSYYTTMVEGSYFALARLSNYSAATVRLVSPIFDLTSVTNPYVKFAHAQLEWSGDQDEMSVYYKASVADEWTLLVNYTNSIASFTYDSIALPNPSATYQISFVASNSYGHGVALDDVQIYSDNGSGPVITNPTVATNAATGIGQTAATLNATITNPDNVTISAKGFEWKTTTGGTFTQIAGTGTGNTFTADLTTLTPGTSYTFKAFITYNGTTTYGQEMTFTTQQQGQPTEPSATTADATNVTYNSATLNGSVANPDNVTITAQGFQWKVSTASTYTTVNATGATMTYNLTGLDASTGYTFRAFVTTANGTSYGQEKTFTTGSAPVEPCDVPTGLTVTDVQSESISVTWDNAAVLRWNVQYGPVGGTLASATASTNSYTFTNLNPLTTYQIQVQAVCEEGNVSEWSPAVEATTTNLNSYLENNVTLYPNPAKEFVDVRIDGDLNVTGMEVYDVYGKLINTINVIDNTTHINVSSLANGMYFVRVTTEQGMVTKRFVKR